MSSVKTPDAPMGHASENAEIALVTLRSGVFRPVTDEDGEEGFAFVRAGADLTLAVGEAFGVELVLRTQTATGARVEHEVAHPDDTRERAGDFRAAGVPFVVAEAYPTRHHLADGTYVITARAKREGFRASATATFRIARDVPPPTLATDAQLAELERRYDTRLCEDARAYFRTVNGLDLDWASHPDLIPERRRDDFDERIEAVLEETETEWYGDDEHLPRQLFPIADEPGVSGVLSRADHFFDARFGPFFYPVGDYPNGDVLVQFAAGRRRGQVGLLQHEYYFGGLEPLLTAEGRAEVGYGGTLVPAKPEPFLDFLDERSYVYSLDKTLAHVLDEYQESLDTQLALYRELYLDA